MDLQLRKIQELAEQKQDELDQQNYEKYHRVFEVAIEYLRTQKVLLYGGMALNELMPARLQFYKKHTLPDIDVFATNAKKTATGLANHLIRAGYKYASYSDALHEGTYKVFAYGLQIADITEMSAYAFKMLSKNSVKGPSKIPIANVEFLRLSLHTMLSQSIDAHRWPKVFDRLVRFYEVFPPVPCPAPKQRVPLFHGVPQEVVEACYKWFKGKPYIHWGREELYDTLDGSAFLDKLPIFMLMVEKQEDLKAVASGLGAWTTSSKVFDGDDFVPPHVVLFHNKQPLAIAFVSDACLTYLDEPAANKARGVRVATIHTILRMVLSIHLSSYPHLHKLRDSLTCLGALLSLKQQNMTNNKRKAQFVLQCYGVQSGLITLRRQMIQKKFIGQK